MSAEDIPKVIPRTRHARVAAHRSNLPIVVQYQVKGLAYALIAAKSGSIFKVLNAKLIIQLQ